MMPILVSVLHEDMQSSEAPIVLNLILRGNYSISVYK